MLGGILIYIPEGLKGDPFKLVFGILATTAGLMAIFFPNALLKPRGKPMHYFIIADGVIKWKEGLFSRKMELGFDEIESYKAYVGEVHFTTSQGEIVKLPIHMIEDKEKHDEFLGLLRESFGKEGSLIAQ